MAVQIILRKKLLIRTLALKNKRSLPWQIYPQNWINNAMVVCLIVQQKKLSTKCLSTYRNFLLSRKLLMKVWLRRKQSKRSLNKKKLLSVIVSRRCKRWKIQTIQILLTSRTALFKITNLKLQLYLSLIMLVITTKVISKSLHLYKKSITTLRSSNTKRLKLAKYFVTRILTWLRVAWSI